MPKKSENFDFEKNLKELEQLVEKLEQGDLSLEESLKQFERGVALTRACQEALSKAEQKVQILLQNSQQDGGKPELENFSPEEEK